MCADAFTSEEGETHCPRHLRYDSADRFHSTCPSDHQRVVPGAQSGPIRACTPVPRRERLIAESGGLPQLTSVQVSPRSASTCAADLQRLTSGRGSRSQLTLDYALKLLMTEADYAQLGMRPAVGRLANGMIAALGPELRLGSPPYNQCRGIIREMQVRPSAAVTAAGLACTFAAHFAAAFSTAAVHTPAQGSFCDAMCLHV